MYHPSLENTLLDSRRAKQKTAMCYILKMVIRQIYSDPHSIAAAHSMSNGTNKFPFLEQLKIYYFSYSLCWNYQLLLRPPK